MMHKPFRDLGAIGRRAVLLGANNGDRAGWTDQAQSWASFGIQSRIASSLNDKKV